VQVRQCTKGSSEITIFHSFARSNYFVQLKYRCSTPPPRRPPYGNIDRAQPPPAGDSSPSHPRSPCAAQPPLSLPLALLSIPFVRFFLSFPFRSSLLFLRLPPSAIPAPIFNYWLRGCSRSIREKRGKNRVAKRFRVRTRTLACVSLASRGASRTRPKAAKKRAR